MIKNYRNWISESESIEFRTLEDKFDIDFGDLDCEHFFKEHNFERKDICFILSGERNKTIIGKYVHYFDTITKRSTPSETLTFRRNVSEKVLINFYTEPLIYIHATLYDDEHITNGWYMFPKPEITKNKSLQNLETSISFGI